MSTQRLRLTVLLVCISVAAAGCAAVAPPLPKAAAAMSPLPDDQGQDEDEGWLWSRLTRRGRARADREESAAVVPASAGEAVGSEGTTPSQVIPASAPAPPAAAPAEPKQDSGYELSNFSPDNLGKTIKRMTGFGPNENAARKLLSEGETLFHQKKYTEAVGRLKSAAGRWPDSPLEEDAMFLQAESYFFSDRYPEAQDAYDRLLEKYENSRYLDTVCKRLFAVGQYWEGLDKSKHKWPVTPNLSDKTRPRFDTFGNAIKAYESIRMHDPIGPLADDSVMAAANAYFRKGRYEDAAYHYDMLRREYPQSEHQPQAHVLGIQAKLRVYQGRLYDGTPLAEADEIAEQALRQFRRELGPEQQRVARARNGITEEKASRDLAVAEYYDKKKLYGAARHYYQAILKDYPRTRVAQRAAARLGQIRGEPDEPPNRFKWLTDAFTPED